MQCGELIGNARFFCLRARVGAWVRVCVYRGLLSTRLTQMLRPVMYLAIVNGACRARRRVDLPCLMS